MKKRPGQLAIFILLISAVVMTVGLSVAKRTVVETKIDTDEELLKQAFNAAESGIDSYLVGEGTDYESSEIDSKAEVAVEDIGGSNSITFEETILRNKTAFLWLRNHDEDNEIDWDSGYDDTEVRVCLNDTSDNPFVGPLKIDYFYLNAGEIEVARAGYNLGGSEEVTGYTSEESECVDYSLTGTPLLLSLTPLLSSAKMTLSGGENFPIQGEKITSVGMAGDLVTAPVTRRVSIVNQHQIPYFMMEAIVAEGEVSD